MMAPRELQHAIENQGRRNGFMAFSSMKNETSQEFCAFCSHIAPSFPPVTAGKEHPIAAPGAISPNQPDERYTPKRLIRFPERHEEEEMEELDEQYKAESDLLISDDADSGDEYEELEAGTATIQGGEKASEPPVYLNVLKLNDFPREFSNDSTPSGLQSPKLLAPSTS
jgi:hypothetical protein